MPATPTPGSTSVATPAAPGSTPAPLIAGSATADFLMLLSQMIGSTPAPAVVAVTPEPPQTPPAPANVPLNFAELPELPALPKLPGSPEWPELVELIGSNEMPLDEELDSTDEETLPEDEQSPAPLAALTLPLLPLPAVAPQQAAEITTPDAEPANPQVSENSEHSFKPVVMRPQIVANAGDAPAPVETVAQAVAASAPKDNAPVAAALIDMATDDAATSEDPAPTTPAPTSSTGSNSTQQISHLQTLATAHALQDAEPALPREIHAPMNTPAWSRELGDHLMLLAQHGREAASLRLSPEHLGPLEVRISMREGEASVWFGAAHADTRNALEQSLPRLRELFASQGLALADAGVFKEAPRQQYKPDAASANSRATADSVEATATRVSTARVGLVDTYV